MNFFLSDNTALILTSYNGHIETVQALIDANGKLQLGNLHKTCCFRNVMIVLVERILKRRIQSNNCFKAHVQYECGVSKHIK